MTHYWWMHWFWITCHLSLCSIFTHSTPLTPMSTVTSQLENQNLIDKTVITKQVTINITSSSTIKTLTTLCINMNITEMNCSDLSSTVTTMLPINSNTTDSESISEYVTTNTTVIVTQQVSKELVSRNRTAESNWNAVSITGVSFGILVCAVFIAASSFLLYRRRYVNKPQTLNDKCSNPDSSGYIDDSTMRENSEEMYSLDNDSFLNSLEAMTIQNYWTDSVKHTKL